MEFNDVRMQYEELASEIQSAITQVLSSGRYILGPVGEAFETDFARYCGVARGVGVASATDALRIGLSAMGVRPGDEVLVPAVSAPATAMAVVQLRARPVFVDTHLDNFTMDPESAFDRAGSRTRAMVPVHLYGMPADLKKLTQARLPILEDAAQAHGSTAPWGRCGSFGRAAAFSFYPTKNLGTYGDGGMLVTSSEEIADRAKLLRNYGQRENYASEIPGDNSRLDEIHAAILRLKLKSLDAWNRRRRAIAEMYRSELRDLPLGLQAETGQSNYHLFVVTTPQRDVLRRYLAEKEIPTIVHYPIPLSRQKAFEEFEPAACPNAERLCARVLSLPMHPSLRDFEVEQVITAIREFFAKHGK